MDCSDFGALGSSRWPHATSASDTIVAIPKDLKNFIDLFSMWFGAYHRRAGNHLARERPQFSILYPFCSSPVSYLIRDFREAKCFLPGGGGASCICLVVAPAGGFAFGGRVAVGNPMVRPH